MAARYEMDYTPGSPEGTSEGRDRAPSAPGAGVAVAAFGVSPERLGNYTKRGDRKGPGIGFPSALVRRFAAQNGARDLMPGERVSKCCRVRIADNVRVVRHPIHGRASYRDVMRCGSVFMCPVCAPKITERRRTELRSGVERAEEKGGSVALVTWTFRHADGDSLGVALDRLQAARKHLRRSKGWRELVRRYGIVGTVRALEPTHGRNGWHPHVHELVVFSGAAPLPVQVQLELLRLWQASCRKVGLGDPNGHGVQYDRADLSVAEYVAKFGKDRDWGAESEVAKGVSKRGRRGSRTPVQLLEDATFYGDDRAGALWQQYARAFKGRRQLAWSPGLREYLGLGVEQTDEEIAEAATAEEEAFAVLYAEAWNRVLGNDARAELLELAGTGDAEAFWRYVEALPGAGGASVTEASDSAAEWAPQREEIGAPGAVLGDREGAAWLEGADRGLGGGDEGRGPIGSEREASGSSEAEASAGGAAAQEGSPGDGAARERTDSAGGDRQHEVRAWSEGRRLERIAPGGVTTSWPCGRAFGPAEHWTARRSEAGRSEASWREASTPRSAEGRPERSAGTRGGAGELPERTERGGKASTRDGYDGAQGRGRHPAAQGPGAEAAEGAPSDCPHGCGYRGLGARAP